MTGHPTDEQGREGAVLDRRREGHRLISAHRCMCGWEGDDALTHLIDVLGLRTEVRNHQWKFDSVNTYSPDGRGVRCGNRCVWCHGWSLGSDRAPDTCPKADRRYVTEWLPLDPSGPVQ